MKDVDAVGRLPQIPEATSLPAPEPVFCTGENNAVLRKVTLRLVPFLCLLYIFNLLDRANVGFARLQMLEDLPIKNWQIDLGYGLFYFGYLLFEVPSNLLLRQVGARHWIARIMMTWGLVGCLTLAVTGPWSFYLVRILLGVAEAGFFPGIVLYLTYWFPARDRAGVMALFMSGNAIAGIVGNPVNGAIMEHLNGAAGLAGWQWLFLLEGIPSVLLGFAVLLYLTDRPEEARWLTTEERAWLVERMNQEEQHRRQRHGGSLIAALTDGRVWLLICLYFTVAVGANASAAYLPQLIKGRFAGWRPSQIGLLAALPHVCAMASMTLLGLRSDRMGERRKHLAFAAFLAAAGWTITGFSAYAAMMAGAGWPISSLAASPWTALVGFCLAQAGMMAMLPIFWALPTSFLSGAAAAGGIALINSMGNLGGLIGPTILGQFGLEAMALTLFVGGMLALVVRRDATLDRR